MLRAGSRCVVTSRTRTVSSGTVHPPCVARCSNQSEAAQAAAQAAKARDAVQRAQFSAMGNVSEQMDAVADAQLELNAQAASLLASLGLSDAAQQLQLKNQEAEAKLKDVKSKGAQINLMGLVQNDIIQEDDNIDK